MVWLSGIIAASHGSSSLDWRGYHQEAPAKLTIFPAPHRTHTKVTHGKWYLAKLESWNIEESRQYFVLYLNTLERSHPWLHRKSVFFVEMTTLWWPAFSTILAMLCPPCFGNTYVQADLQFGDYKCAAINSRKSNGRTPDMVLLDGENSSRWDGETRTPWVHTLQTKRCK